MMWFKAKKCCCDEIRQELKRRLDTLDYGVVTILNTLKDIERKEGVIVNPYGQKPWRIEVPTEEKPNV
jgi:hypothetical protein